MKKYLPYAENDSDGKLLLKTRLAKNVENYCTFIPLTLFIALVSAYFSYRFYDLYHSNGSSHHHHGLFLTVFVISWFASLFAFFYLMSKFFDGRERILHHNMSEDEIISRAKNKHETIKKFSISDSYNFLKESDALDEKEGENEDANREQKVSPRANIETVFSDNPVSDDKIENKIPSENDNIEQSFGPIVNPEQDSYRENSKESFDTSNNANVETLGASPVSDAVVEDKNFDESHSDEVSNSEQPSTTIDHDRVIPVQGKSTVDEGSSKSSLFSRRKKGRFAR